MKKENGILKEVVNSDAEISRKKPNKFWKNINKIGPYAFRNCDQITTLNIPNTVREISKNAFSQSKIQYISFFYPNGKLEDGCFAFASELRGVSLSVEYNRIPNNMFYFGTNLRNFKIRYGAESIGDEAFGECRNMDIISIPDTVSHIGRCAFKGCGSLKSIVLTNNKIDELFSSVFENCSGLTNVRLPDELKIIGNNVFKNCSSLISIDLPSTLCHIGEKAFCDCKKIKTIDIPKEVSHIGEYAFSGCCDLESVVFNSPYIEIISRGAFEKCKSLKKINVPAGVKVIDSFAFSSCSSLKKVKLPDGLEELGDGVFSNCDSLEMVSLPKSLKKMTEYTFMHTEFKYFNRLSNGTILLTKNKLTDYKDAVSLDLERMNNVFPKHTVIDLLKFSGNGLKNYIEIINYYQNKKITNLNVSIEDLRALEIAKLINSINTRR